MKSSLVTLLLLTSTCLGALEAKRADGIIAIDGKLDEAAWAGAPAGNLALSGGKAVVNPTTVRVLFDDVNLYVGFDCQQKRMDLLVNEWTHVEERDNDIWLDDCVEIFLAPLEDRQQYYHIIVNASGVLYDKFIDNSSWDPDIKTATAKRSDGWSVEIAIPFEDLNVTPKGGESWVGNLCREQKSNNENSSLFPIKNGFGDPSTFGKLKFEAPAGEMAFILNRLAPRGMLAEIRNSGTLDQSVQVTLKSVEDGSVILDHKADVKAGGVRNLTLPYELPKGTSRIAVQATRLADGKVIYANTIPLTAAPSGSASARVWQVDKPLYKELLSDEPIGYARDGLMTWAHGIDASAMRNFALQYGQRHVHEEFFKRLVDSKLMPIANTFMIKHPPYDMPAMLRKHGIKAVLMAYSNGGSEFTIDKLPFLPDPGATEFFLNSINECLDEYPDIIWGIMPGDEMFEHDEKRGVQLFETRKNDYEFIRQADEEVKKTYGGGVYGIPLSLKDDNPYRWIAYRRWLNDKYAEMLTRMYKNVKSRGDYKMFSFDPISFHHPYDFSRAREYCDIVNHQLYPRREGQYTRFGFITKLIVDLSGIEVWPCAHVEEYAASFTPQEVLELVSQIFRNGATGLNYYPDDTVGKRAKVKCLKMEYYGAPDRWQIETALVREITQMNRPRLPQADFAIMYSCDSYGADIAGAIPGEQAEFAYLILGPYVGSWFKFIDDNQIARGTINLDDFKAVYVPYAPYQRREVVEKLIDYVKGGGKLVCGDPLAFSFDVHGKDYAGVRAELFGKNARHLNDADARKRRTTELKPSRVKLGKGHVYYFSDNPFEKKLVIRKDYQAFFRDFQKMLGLKTGHEIWRFQFPMELIKPISTPSGICLTGNYIHWEGFKPLSINNVAIAGTYTYSIAPDGFADAGGASNVPFSAGDLTNRTKAPTAGNVEFGKSKLDDWVVSYKTTEPFAITFDLAGEYDLKSVKLFYSHGGQRPAVTVEGSSDGAVWTTMGSVAQNDESAHDVRDLEIPLSGKPMRFLRIGFAGRSEGHSLTLSEIEIWAKQLEASAN